MASQRQCFQDQPHDPKLTPLDHIPPSIPNRFEQIKKREIYWFYKLRSLQPMGLNEVTEVIIR